MNIRQATESYENWMASCIPVDRHALSFKHKQMTLGFFPFLRATFYRWVQIWREVAGDAAMAPSLLAVGDLHLENFATSRDVEGRSRKWIKSGVARPYLYRCAFRNIGIPSNWRFPSSCADGLRREVKQILAPSCRLARDGSEKNPARMLEFALRRAGQRHAAR